MKRERNAKQSQKKDANSQLKAVSPLFPSAFSHIPFPSC